MIKRWVDGGFDDYLIVQIETEMRCDGWMAICTAVGDQNPKSRARFRPPLIIRHSTVAAAHRQLLRVDFQFSSLDQSITWQLMNKFSIWNVLLWTHFYFLCITLANNVKLFNFNSFSYTTFCSELRDEFLQVSTHIMHTLIQFRIFLLHVCKSFLALLFQTLFSKSPNLTVADQRF